MKILISTLNALVNNNLVAIRILTKNILIFSNIQSKNIINTSKILGVLKHLLRPITLKRILSSRN